MSAHRILAHTQQGHLFGLLSPLLLLSTLSGAELAQLPALDEIQANEARREKFQKVPEVLSALQAKEGSWIADVGAWQGFFTVRIAQQVGKNGRVFAVEIKKDLLDLIRQRAQAAGLDNIELLLGKPGDPGLPVSRLDGVLIVNSYHEMEKHDFMLSHIYQALKPGGRLVMTEPSLQSRRNWPRKKQVERHEIAPDIAEAEIREAGFQVLERRDSFISPSKDLADFSGPGGWWMIVALHPLRTTEGPR